MNDGEESLKGGQSEQVGQTQKIHVFRKHHQCQLTGSEMGVVQEVGKIKFTF
jgi:hypothetical protein